MSLLYLNRQLQNGLELKQLMIYSLCTARPLTWTIISYYAKVEASNIYHRSGQVSCIEMSVEEGNCHNPKFDVLWNETPTKYSSLALCFNRNHNLIDIHTLISIIKQIGITWSDNHPSAYSIYINKFSLQHILALPWYFY